MSPIKRLAGLKLLNFGVRLRTSSAMLRTLQLLPTKWYKHAYFQMCNIAVIRSPVCMYVCVHITICVCVYVQ